jgi:hypothetical protein
VRAKIECLGGGAAVFIRSHVRRREAASGVQILF